MGLGIPIIGNIIDGVKDLLGEAIVDKDKKLAIELELAKLAAEGDKQLNRVLIGQIDLNKEEAKHGSVFVAGWRPFVGWVGGFSLAYSAIVYPFMSWGSRIAGYKGDLPVLDNTLLMTIMVGMLGIGAQRSYEKAKGVSTNDFTNGEGNPPAAKKKFLGIALPRLPENAPWA